MPGLRFWWLRRGVYGGIGGIVVVRHGESWGRAGRCGRQLMTGTGSEEGVYVGYGWPGWSGVEKL
jgi:N-acyl-D-aspartate/D-glutamate deacylase